MPAFNAIFQYNDTEYKCQKKTFYLASILNCAKYPKHCKLYRRIQFQWSRMYVLLILTVTVTTGTGWTIWALFSLAVLITTLSTQAETCTFHLVNTVLPHSFLCLFFLFHMMQNGGKTRPSSGKFIDNLVCFTCNVTVGC